MDAPASLPVSLTLERLNMRSNAGALERDEGRPSLGLVSSWFGNASLRNLFRVKGE